LKAPLFIRLGRTIKRANRSFGRSSLGNFITIVILALIFLMVHLASVATSASSRVINNLQKQVDIAVPLKSDASEFAIDEFLLRLEGLASQGVIEDFRFVSEEENLEEFANKYPGRTLYLQRQEISDPFPAMVTIVPSENALIDLFAFLESPEFLDVVNQTYLKNNETDKQTVERFLFFAQYTEKLTLTIVIFFLIIAGFLIFHALNGAIARYQDEVFIMRLVGAKYSTIRGTFLLEGLLITFLAFLISLGLAALVIYYFYQDFSQFIGSLGIAMNFSGSLSDWLNLLSEQVLLITASAAILAILASFIAIESKLRKRIAA
jgi:cell division protein FtsX